MQPAVVPVLAVGLLSGATLLAQKAVATSGTWTIDNPEVVGNTVYAWWYHDGVRVIDSRSPGARA
ncbi:MAG TPA: hypothetical protein VK992_05945, partial [Candidatus Caenarcaniphilales bacterium]|nr:hypothetical protein [Candidatus Caenarcaniphilales bacterium]